MLTLNIPSLESIHLVAREFISQMGENKIFAFYGNMGAGKTTFIRALCSEMGVKDIVNSPTFSIVNEYTTAFGKQIYHFDLYRINTIQDALNFGCEDYFYSGNICLLEWPEKIEELLPDETVKIQIQELENGQRQLLANL